MSLPSSAPLPEVVVAMAESLRAAAPGEDQGQATDRAAGRIDTKCNPRPDIEAATPVIAGVAVNPRAVVEGPEGARGHLPQRLHADRYDRHQASRWFESNALETAPRRHFAAEIAPGCNLTWVLSVPRPATFAEALDLGALDVDDLAVPVGAVDGVGGGS